MDYTGEAVFVQCAECGGYHEAPKIEAYQNALETACNVVSESSHQIGEAFGLGQPDGRWDMAPDDGVFYFTNADGRRSFAEFSLVGSWIERTHSWLWGWALPDTHITERTRKAPDLARAKGEAEGWPCLTTPYLMLNANEAWHLTKYSAWLAGYPLVYRASVNEKAKAYFAIDQLRWAN